MKYNVIITIPSFADENTGIGGHYRSLLTLQSLLSNTHHALIISYGTLKPPVYDDVECATHIFVDSKLHLTSLKDRLLRLIKNSIQHTVIISLSPRDLFSLRNICKNTNSSLVFCKPGGPPRKSDRLLGKTPSIVFTGTDYESYCLASPSTLPFLFSSRVMRPNYDATFNENFMTKVGWTKPSYLDKKQCLIVCRITAEKDNFISAACQYLKTIENSNLSVVFVGHVQDDLYLSSLRTNYPFITFVTDQEFTSKAAMLFHTANLSICIGRTAQESIASGVPCFLPITYGNTTKLMFASPRIASNLFRHNFTHRISQESSQLPSDLKDIGQILGNRKSFEDAISDTQYFFEHYLDQKKQISDLNIFLEQVVKSKPLDYLSTLALSIYYQSRQQAKRFIPSGLVRRLNPKRVA